MISFGKLSFHRICRRQTPTSILDIYEMYRRCTAAVLPTGSTAGNILIPVWVPGRRQKRAHIGCIITRVKGWNNSVFLKLQDDTDYIRDAIVQFGFGDKVPDDGLANSPRFTLLIWRMQECLEYERLFSHYSKALAEEAGCKIHFLQVS
ncbi:hypothetical protein CFIMG_002885RAa [Ceratocystis fimbriata CBS 114723]|uniref:Uncharacterized protein n=1 Tax=Ceratocystis fimbriata CBS 114723 TaxID=1035309 RepID=A0A2C5XBH5_9PEZI|nr:hypothetical protein CFIMG_002885RAa [Ceratocystis fimbriata CBS 114723]